MPLNEESKARINEFAKELRALMDTLDIRFWEGGVVRVAPAGAAPAFCTVEIEGVWDENVRWSGVPGGLSAGDEVLVWENPVTHRREIIGGSGGTATKPFVHDHHDDDDGGPDLNPETISTRALIVGTGCTYTTLGAAVAAVPGTPCTIKVMGITTIEGGDVTVPSGVTVICMGEGSIIGMGANTLHMSDDSYMQDVVVTGSGTEVVDIDDVTGIVLRNVKAIQSAAAFCFRFHQTAGGECYHCIAETTAGNAFGFSVEDDSEVMLWDCDANDASNFTTAFVLDDTAECTTLYCRFAGSSNDVWTAAGTTWYHFKCEWDANNSTLGGTETPLQDGAVEIASDAIRGHDSLYPDLGTTTAAQMIGDVYIAAGHDAYPDADTAGLAERCINFGRDPVEDFRAAFVWLTTGWAGAPFNGTPDTLDFTTYPDFLVVGDGTTNDRFFRYRTITYNLGDGADVRGRLDCVSDCRAGIRIDTGDDTDFAELYIETAATGLCDIVSRYQENGGGITTTVEVDDIPIETFRLRLAVAANNQIRCYYAIDTHLEALLATILGDIDNWSTTPTRVGIIFERTAGTNTAARRGYYDWFDTTFSTP